MKNWLRWLRRDGDTTAPGLRDDVYVDEKRLDSYVEQITSSVAYDNVPKLKVGMKISGPFVEATQEQVPRLLTRTEKINILLAYLKKKDYLGTTRLNAPWGEHHLLRFERCEVVAVNIAAPGPNKGILMWVSESSETGAPDKLLLLRDSMMDDEDGYVAKSAYSALLVLREEGYDFKQAFKAVTKGPLAEVRSLLDAHLLEGSPLYQESRRRERVLLQQLSEDPVAFFRWLGGQIGARQKIQTLYRVRTVTTDPINPETAVTVAYPIFISRGSST